MASDPILARIKAELQRLYGSRLQDAILYGSRARGDARPDSDHDVAVVLKDYDDDFQEVYRLADLEYDLLLETGAAISAYPFAPSDLTKRTLFMHNLRTEGVPL